MFNGKLFCEMNPVFYAISEQKEICRRHIKNIHSIANFRCNIFKIICIDQISKRYTRFSPQLIIL